MADQRIIDYVNRFKRNYSIKVMRERLIDQGYPPEDVDEAIKIATSGMSKGSHKKVKIAVVVIIVVLALYFLLPFISWMYLSTYWGERVLKSFQIMDSYCVSGNATLLIHNTGTDDISTDEVTVIELETATDLNPGTDYRWADSGDPEATVKIEPGETAKLIVDCGRDKLCSYRLAIGARSVTVSVQC